MEIHPQTKDVTGEVYNRFTIIGLLPPKRYGKHTYKQVLARCECGQERSLVYKDLKKGKVKACGCLAKEIKIDIEKESVYYYWTILKEVDPYVYTDGSKMRRVAVKCRCGNENEILLSSLRTGNSKSCGCKPKPPRIKKEPSEIKPLDIEAANKKDLGKWTVLKETETYRDHNNKIKRKLLVRCSCGTEKEMLWESLHGKDGTKSCHPCSITKKPVTEEMIARKILKTKHAAMKSRCYNIDCKDFISYGAKGIIMCQEWKDNFELFYQWSLEQGYVHGQGLEIDRKDNDKGYSPENCRYITRVENRLNMKSINLTPEDVRFIRSSKFDIFTMAGNYSCSVDVIKRIRAGKTFTEIV